MTPEIDDWIVFATRRHAQPAEPLGGPWCCGRIAKVNAASYSVDQVHDTDGPRPDTRWVMADRVSKVCISKGEAVIAIREIAKLEAEYAHKRANLKPEYQLRISAILAD